MSRSGVFALACLVSLALCGPSAATEWQLTTDPAFDRDPAWSPDGTEIAFSSNRGGTFDIWVMSSQGEAVALRRVTNMSTSETDPAWSPDGSLIAFELADEWGDESHIVCVDVSQDSGDVWLLSFGGLGGIGDISPDWSPDGSQIVFSSDRLGGLSIMLMDARGETCAPATPLTSNAWDDFVGSWSPTAASICFTTYRGAADSGTIWYMPAAGEAQGSWQLTSGHTDQNASWSPNEDHIAFARKDEGIMVYSFETRLVTPVTAGNDFIPAWSPDGSEIAFCRKGLTSDIWVTDLFPVIPVVKSTTWGCIKALYR